MMNSTESARELLARLIEQAGSGGGCDHQAEILSAATQLLSELDTADEELRTQNQDLLEAQHTLEIERLRYQELYEYAPDAYLLTNAAGKILELNLAACTLLNGYHDMLVSKPLSVYIEPDNLPEFRRLLKTSDQAFGEELRVRPPRGRTRDVLANVSAVKENQTRERKLRWALRDVTERNEALKLLDVSERHFRKIYDEAHLGIVLCNLDWRILRANPAFTEMTGYTTEELVSHDLRALADEDGVLRQVPPGGEGEEATLRAEARFRRKDGSLGWANLTVSQIHFDLEEGQRLLVMVEDITQKKAADAELVELRNSLMESVENERLRLAQELHDSPMQDLYGVVFKISNLLAQLDDSQLRFEMTEAQSMVKHVAGQLRGICGELRPPTITSLGLEKAIRSHADSAQVVQPELEIDLELASDGQELDPAIRITLFRIYQQCMMNLLRHSNATRALVSFQMDEREAVLDVWDNGKGFSLPEKWVEFLRKGHYGLAGIAERVSALNGELKIDTRPGSGTLVHVSLPRRPREGSSENG